MLVKTVVNETVLYIAMQEMLLQRQKKGEMHNFYKTYLAIENKYSHYIPVYGDICGCTWIKGDRQSEPGLDLDHRIFATIGCRWICLNHLLQQVLPLLQGSL